MVDPGLDGPREIVEFGKDRAERRANNGIATILGNAALAFELRGALGLKCDEGELEEDAA